MPASGSQMNLKAAAYAVSLCIAAEAGACRCEWSDPKALYQQSDIVVLARVERLRPEVRQGTGDGAAMTLCHVQLQPTEAIKGAAAEPLDVTYDANSPDFCGRAETGPDVKEIMLASCAHDMSIGETYVIFHSGGQPLHLESSCDPRVRLAWPDSRAFLEQLRDGG
jgi:hypothetical protein